MKGNAMKLGSLALALLFTGCATLSAGPFPGTVPAGALYFNRMTGDMQSCVNRNPPVWSISDWNIPTLVAYADCKTALEEQGYVRFHEDPRRPWSVEWDRSCRYRIRSVAADQALAEYRRCMAGD